MLQSKEIQVVCQFHSIQRKKEDYQKLQSDHETYRIKRTNKITDGVPEWEPLWQPHHGSKGTGGRGRFPGKVPRAFIPSIYHKLRPIGCFCDDYFKRKRQKMTSKTLNILEFA